MRQMIFAVVLLALLSMVTMPLAAAGAGGGTPNVIVILTDDQGWGDLSLHGNTNVATPNIDSLGKSGAQFDRFFVCSVCSPTRAEFLTGRYHPRGGVYSTSEGGERLNVDETTIAQVFKKAGYATAAFGKWHNGTQGPYHPNSRGFDEYYGFTSGHWGDYYSPPLDHNGQIVKGDGFIIDDFTNRAMKFIESRRDQPFFVYIPYNTPHTPAQVPAEFYKKFDSDAAIKMRANPASMFANDGAAKKGKNAKAAPAPKAAAKDGGKGAGGEDLLLTRAALAMVENIDWNVGRLLKKLDELKVADNTIIVFFHDNGPNGWRWNGDMRGRKGSTDEGGVRSPLLMRWPAAIKPGTRVPNIASAADLLPTLADLAGVEISGTKPLDGASFKSVLLGSGAFAQPERLIVSHWSGRLSVRSQQYRLDHAGRLYDMLADGGQTTDVAAKHPEITKRLAAEAEKYRAEVLPGIKNDDRPLPVGYKPLPLTQLPARDGRGHGNIQRSAKAPNCSYFTNFVSKDDRITWDVDVLTPGRYEAVLYYTCAKDDVGCVLELSHNGAAVRTKITEAHDPPLYGRNHDLADRGSESEVKDFKPLTLGVMDLKAGRGPLTLKALEIPGKQAVDVRLITLKLIP